MYRFKKQRTRLAILMTGLIASAGWLSASASSHYGDTEIDDKPIHIEMFAPAKGDKVGIGGRGWFVDLAIQYSNTTLEQTGFSSLQLTGPAAHNNIAPFPGTFSVGADDKLPGLIVLLSTTGVGAMSCQNIANLFNLTGISNVTEDEIEIWDTWLIGAPNFGVNVDSKIYVAVAADTNGDGIYNDAPNVIPDSNGDGICDTKDLREFGLASNIAKAQFFINP